MNHKIERQKQIASCYLNFIIIFYLQLKHLTLFIKKVRYLFKGLCPCICFIALAQVHITNHCIYFDETNIFLIYFGKKLIFIIQTKRKESTLYNLIQLAFQNPIF